MSTELTSIELAQLERAEQRIEKGMSTFVDVGKALAEIRNDKLYLKDHKTFEAYCDKRWGISRSRAYQLLDGADVVSNVHNCGHDTHPTTESLARPLTKLKKPEQQAEAWKEAVDAANGEVVTAALVEKAVAKRVSPKPKMKVKAENETVRVQSREPGEDDRPIKNGAEVWPMKDRKRAAKHLGDLIRSIPYNSPAHKKALPHLDALTLIVEKGA